MIPGIESKHKLYAQVLIVLARVFIYLEWVPAIDEYFASLFVSHERSAVAIDQVEFLNRIRRLHLVLAHHVCSSGQ